MAGNMWLRWCGVLAGVLGAGTAQAAWELNMPVGVTAITREVYGLHMLIFWICVAIGVVVFGAMIYSLIAHRKARGVTAAQFHESTAVEIGWTIIPFVILIGMAIPAAGTLLKIEDSSNSDVSIKATGHQWLWQYEYIDQGVNIYSRLDADSNAARQVDSGIDPSTVDNYLRAVDNRMVVPVDKKVRLLLTSNDVIHAWWVPELSGKKDAIPGYVNEIWFRAEKTGVYRGQCAELCGRGHGFMPIVVEVVSQADYETWLAKQGGGKQTQTAAAEQAGGQTATDAGGAAADRASPDSGGQPSGGGDSQVAQGGGGGDSGGSAAADQKSPDGGGQSSGEDKGQAAQAEGGGGSEGGAGGGEMSKDDLMATGEQIYKGQCAACHQADGAGLPPTFPALTGSAIASGPAPEHIKRVLNGLNAMPAYAASMSNEEIAAVVTYERNALGNDTGDVVQPSAVEAER